MYNSQYNILAPSGKSIIEEWKNPRKYSGDLLRNDQVYEERAVDVINHPLKKSQQSTLSLRITNDDVNKNNDDKLIKIKRPQDGGIVRNIPIKDYQASIAQNIGTLRRSVAPQWQFESLISEPEKNIHVLSKKRIPLNNSLHQRTTSQTTCTASQIEASNTFRKSFCYFCNDQHDQSDYGCTNANLNDTEDNRYFGKIKQRKSQDDSDDTDEYFRKSSQKKSSLNSQQVSKRDFSQENTEVTNRDVKKIMEQAKVLQLGESNVGQKISTYEQNARCSLRDSNSRSILDMKGHQAIGVPLVGMHNACGLPVVASWHDHELLEPLRISRKITSTFYKSSRSLPNIRRRAQPKRKAPQPDRATIHSKDIDKRSTIKLVAHLDAINDSLSRKRHRRSTFTPNKVTSLSSKNSFKRTTRHKRHGIKTSSLMGTFSKRSLKERNAKRRTLYAKDDGEEAVEVLKNLCLNPLARINPETDMIW